MFKKISETQVKSVVKRKRVYVLARDTVYKKLKKSLNLSVTISKFLEMQECQ